MTKYLPESLRQQLAVVDNGRCAYCQTAVANTGQPLTIDHIVPQAEGGQTNFDNLCLACRTCNEYKGKAISATDPLTGDDVPLFHPRRQRWQEHLAWDESGCVILGLTACGRATTVALNMNNEVMVAVRRRWVSAGWHPPSQT